MKTKTIILAGFLAAFLVVSAFVLSSMRNSGADGGTLKRENTRLNETKSAPLSSKKKYVATAPYGEIQEADETILGAVPGNQINFDYLEINGIGHYYYEIPMTSYALNGGTATGTVCALKLPTASTTLMDYNAVIHTSAPTTTAKFALYHIPPQITTWATSSVRALGGISSTIAQGGRLVATSTQATSTLATGMFLQGSSSGDNESWLLFDLEGGSQPFIGRGLCRVELREL